MGTLNLGQSVSRRIVSFNTHRRVSEVGDYFMQGGKGLCGGGGGTPKYSRAAIGLVHLFTPLPATYPPIFMFASIYPPNLMSKTIKTFNGPAKNRTAEEARRLSISEDTLLELWNRGIVPGIKIGHRAILFDPLEVDATLKKHFGSGGKKRE